MEDYYWDIADARKMGQYLTRKERLFIDSFLERNTIGICLDVACGSGRFTIPISQYGINVVAVDYDLVPVRKLKDKTREKEQVTIIRANANKLPFKESCFDCIISVETVDYLDAKDFFAECNKILKKDGFLLFTLEAVSQLILTSKMLLLFGFRALYAFLFRPILNCWTASLGNKHTYKRYIHRVLSCYRTFYRYSFDEIRSYLEEEGFKIEKCVGYNWVPFRRTSNSVLIGLFEFLENVLRLDRHPAISPWVFFIAKKKEGDNENSC